MQADVIIIGGGILGSAAAYFLARNADFYGTVAVIETDLTYRWAATTRSAASLRQQFAVPENIRMSRFGCDFIRGAEEELGIGDWKPDIAFDESGYLMLATEEQANDYRANLTLQRAEGVEIEHLSVEEIAKRFPWLNLDGIALGSLGLAGEGWFDATQLLFGLRRKAEQLGVKYIDGRAVAIGQQGSKVSDVRLASGDRIACGAVVNAAGPKAREVAAMAGLGAPVESRKRCIFTFESAAKLPNCPFVYDPLAGAGGFYFRPDGDHFLCATAPDPASDKESFDYVVDQSLFHQVILPALVRRVPMLNDLSPGKAWAGHYDYNVFDMNALVGPTSAVENFYFLNGFSGHGVMHAPAAGRAISELIATGAFQTLDLAIFSPDRIARGHRLRDLQCCEPSGARSGRASLPRSGRNQWRPIANKAK